MQRELSTFPLSPNYLHKLSSAGYATVDDLKDVTPTELSEGKLLISALFNFFLVLIYQYGNISRKNFQINSYA